jgi:hypothetical protein
MVDQEGINSNSDGSITRRQEIRVSNSNSISQGEEAEERRVLEEPRKPSTFCRLLSLFSQVIRNPLMNAAVTIFSLGIGVGLILGDSFRDERSADHPNDATDEDVPRLAYDRRSNPRPQRRHQIEELPGHSPAAALLPAQ